MNLPKPLQYALSGVLLAIGFAVAYQVAIGEAFKYKGPLGDIELGSGADKTTITMREFLNRSEVALKEARVTIDEQESVITQLQKAIAKYEIEVVSLKQLSERLSAANTQGQRRRINSVISSKVASLNATALAAAKIETLSMTKATKLRLEKQATLISTVKKTVSKK